MSILVCSLGQSWAVIPELYGIVAPERLPLYGGSTATTALVAGLRAHLVGAAAVDEVWIVTTAGTDGVSQIRAWWTSLGSPGRLRVWRTAAGDGAAQREVELIRELIMRAVLAAGPHAVLGLSGGRKTMSADMQRAGMVFGCAGMIHVLPPEPLPPFLRSATSSDLIKPLPAGIADQMQPVLVGRGTRSDILDVEPVILPSRYPMPAEDSDFASPGAEGWLWQAVEQREREGSHLLASFHAEIISRESHENWRSLYRLPLAIITDLHQRRLGPSDRALLQQVPKADIHCHLGGALDLPAQRGVAAAVWQALSIAERQEAERLASQVDLTAPDWALRLKAYGARRPQVVAALFARHDDDAALSTILWDPSIVRVNLKETHSFAAYERPGELSGSAILQHPAAIAPTVAALVARAKADGIVYLEVRGSPLKYAPGFIDAFHAALPAEGPLVRFVAIADRRHPDQVANLVDWAIQARERLGGFVVGIDLAGDEQDDHGVAEKVAPAFSKAFAACLPITIHAGEGQPADRIWEASYLLHADRIGHGLSLADNEALAARFRDRRICLELCPTSNREVVGFRDPLVPASASSPLYPLRALIELALPLTLCTDNPGISRTTLADEYLTAARMMPNGLTWWESLAMMKQAFMHAFLPSQEREVVIKQTDLAVGAIIRGQVDRGWEAPILRM